MKKSTLLSFATAGAIVVTSAGTYAAWDTLTGTTESTITFRNPVTITVDSEYDLNETSATLNTLPSATGEVTFNVQNPGDLADTLTLTPTVSGASVNDFDFVIADTTGNLQKDSANGFVDKSLGTTTYTVTVTPKDTSLNAVAGKPVTIELTAELSKSK